MNSSRSGEEARVYCTMSVFVLIMVVMLTVIMMIVLLHFDLIPTFIAAGSIIRIFYNRNETSPSFHEFGELTQTNSRVVREILPQPGEMSISVNHEHALVRRLNELNDVAVDACVPAIIV